MLDSNIFQYTKQKRKHKLTQIFIMPIQKLHENVAYRIKNALEFI